MSEEAVVSPIAGTFIEHLKNIGLVRDGRDEAFMMRFVKKLDNQEQKGQWATSVSARDVDPQDQICIQALTKYLMYQRESLEYIATHVHKAFKGMLEEGTLNSFKAQLTKVHSTFLKADKKRKAKENRDVTPLREMNIENYQSRSS